LLKDEKREGVTVTGVLAFGVFVDVGAARDGLIPLRELPADGVAVGQKLPPVYVRHVDLARGRLTLSRSPLGNGGGERSRSESRASNASTESVESRASRLSVGSRLSHASTARATREEQRGAAFEAISAALDLWPDTFCFTGSVVNLTDFGAFVRLDAGELAKVMGACHSDGIISVAAAPGDVRVDGLLRQREIVAGYRAGVIGAAGEANGITVGKVLRVRILSVDVQQRQLQLSLLAAPSVRPAARPIQHEDRFGVRRPQGCIEDAMPAEKIGEAESVEEDALVPAEVDNETLASRLLWQPQAVTIEHEAPPLAVRTLRRLPHGSFRTVKLVDLPWKTDEARLPQHPACAAC